MKKQTYSDPWDEIEARANNYSAKAIMAMVVVILAVWVLTVADFFVIDSKMMTQVTIVSVAGFLSLRALLYFYDNSKRWLKYVVLSVICLLCGIIVSALSFHAVLLYALPLIFASQYSRQHVIWCTLIVDVIVVAVSSLIAFYYGLCDLNIFFVSMSNHSHFMKMMEDEMCLPLNPDPTFVILVYATIPRAMILALFAYMLSKVTEKSRAEAAQMAKAKIVSETDFITGVYNKNKYAEMIKDHYPKIESVAVIFWDINNLKVVNDEFGHEMGDQVIIKLAEILLSRADKRHNVYRIGGDEFITVIDNPLPGEEKRYEADTVRMIEETATRAKVPVSVAHGASKGRGADILQTINEADAAMYACKRAMKGEASETVR